MPKHVHAELIKLWADGAEIQREEFYYNRETQWVDDHRPTWHCDNNYRLKPKPKTIKYKRYLGKQFYDNDSKSVYFIGVTRHDVLGIQGPEHVIVKWIDTEWQEVEVPE